MVAGLVMTIELPHQFQLGVIQPALGFFLRQAWVAICLPWGYPGIVLEFGAPVECCLGGLGGVPVKSL